MDKKHKNGMKTQVKNFKSMTRDKKTIETLKPMKNERQQPRRNKENDRKMKEN